MEIVYKTKNTVVIYKPAGIPSQPDLSGDADAMTLTKDALRAEGENAEIYLIHRLDRTVSGLLVFARNKKYAALLSEYVKERLLTKEYFAVVDGKLESGVLEDLIYKDSSKSKAFIVDRERRGVKKAKLTCKNLASVDTERGIRSLVYITLDTGRFHQIRAQLSHRGAPITGDGKYGSKDNKAKNLALIASHLAFSIGNETVNITRLPSTDIYPWSLFDKENYTVGKEND